MKRILGILMYSVMAGICIGLGGTVFLRLRDAFPGGVVVGAFFFSIGLFVVCTRGYYLYTGKVCYVLDNNLQYSLDTVLVWIGNLLGCMLMGAVENLTVICGGTGIDATAAALVQAKLDSSLVSLFFLGCICNMCIFIGVNGYQNNPHELGKYLAIFLGVTVFICCGTEHSVADMYYWCVSRMVYEDPAQFLLRVLVISLGNLVGGVFIRQVEKWKGQLDEKAAS